MSIYIYCKTIINFCNIINYYYICPIFKKTIAMQTTKNKSMIKVLKRAIDIALILQLIWVICEIVTSFPLINFLSDISLYDNLETTLFGHNVIIFLSNPDLPKYIYSIRKNFMIFNEVSYCIDMFAFILITFQLKYLFKYFIQDDYFNPINSKWIKNIALIIFLWVIFDFIIRFVPNIFIPNYFICQSIGMNSFRNGFSFGTLEFNYKLLFVSIIIYVISFVFKHGSKLQEESSLTI